MKVCDIKINFVLCVQNNYFMTQMVGSEQFIFFCSKLVYYYYY